jgi:4-diphosphocytidyl-2-C-methyl-D-erythritol kinase
MKQFEMINDGLIVRAPAKINISLLIAGKRDDGFHAIETIMSKISLYDDLMFETGVSAGIELVCKGRYKISSEADNLVFRACRMVLDAVGTKGDDLKAQGVKVTLTKRIPIGAGLGGGSSDASAALMGLNRFGNLGLDNDTLSALAGELGSDVAFFLGGPLAMCTGRGEKIQRINADFPFRALLVLPDVNASTKGVYGNYTHDAAVFDDLSRQINDHLCKNRLDLITDMCVNMLECACYRVYEDLGEIKSRILSLGIGPVCLSGSGSTMYILDTGKSEDNFDDCQAMLEERIGCETIIVDSNRW